MLELRNISKSYKTGNFKQIALKDINLKFRKSEFVCILGQSGSGKTTLLNILSGLDRYDKGDLIINNKSTREFKSADWDAYRNNCIGFIFQSYNLIHHISVLDNVELGLTLSGVAKKERRKRALNMLDKVGLKKHINKKPNQLSGGQMQRVAIARAIVNNPDVILADEPTGALDTKTSKEIMNLIKEIAKDKLVIMVTHNPELAKEYATRIIELSDGKIIKDSNPIIEQESDNKKYEIKKTAMSFLTALSLSLNNIKTKKGRTILTSFACSIGIIGISLVLALSNGFDKQIDIFEADTLSSLPIMINSNVMEIDEEDIKNRREEVLNSSEEKEKIIPYDVKENMNVHQNIINSEYLEYLNKIDPSNILGITYMRSTGLNLVMEKENGIKILNTDDLNMQTTPKYLGEQENYYLEQNYELVAGSFPKEMTDIVLLLDSNNRIDTTVLESLSLPTDHELSYDEVLDIELKVIMNDDFYRKYGNIYSINSDTSAMFDSEDAITLRITGIIRNQNDNKLTQIQEMMGINGVGGIFYTNELIEKVISINSNSEIVEAQRNSNLNVLTGETISDSKVKENLLLYLGSEDKPISILIYPSNFNNKDKILNYLDQYNKDKDISNQIIYTDMASSIVDMSSNIMDAITYVLIAFSAVNLIVSGIMIAIITNISVLERTKEIGILRSLGARKKDITRVFNAETIIIGLSSGLLGIIIARLLIFPINIILENITNLEQVARMSIYHVILMVGISIIVTLVGGLIPAVRASHKDPVEALRTE